jgi:maltose alpha-D-glucosyltransferase/alpha-amylase
MFLRNHDELTLEMVTDAERDYLWSTYAADPRARINLGIRRRLAPLMDNDRRKIELMNSILMSMPGTPIIYYGDEIGMGDNIYLGDRNGVRTPMQWTPDRNGGFSRADPARLYLPPIMDPVYGYSAVNVEAQQRSLSSLLSWMKRLIAVRKSTKVFGRGTLTFIRPKNRTVLAYVRQLGDEAILCVANISRTAQAVELDMSQWKGRIPQEMLGRTRFPRIGDLPYLVTLPPYGYFWFSLNQEADHEPESTLPREITTLVIGPGWDSMLSGWTRRTLDLDVLPHFVSERRWYADKASRQVTMSCSVAIPIERNSDQFLAGIVDVSGTHSRSRYFLPLTIHWTRYTQIDRGPASVIAAVRRGPREGVLLDATAETEFITALLEMIHNGETVGSEAGQIEFRPTGAFTADPLPEIKNVAAISREQSNSSVIVDNKFVVKILRRITPGIHPEVEVGRFLADVAHFQNAPTLFGSVELVEGENRSALAVVNAFVENQGDAWSLAAGALDRLVEEHRLLTSETPLESLEIASMTQRVRQIGKRTAEMHLAFACRDDIPAFAPEPITAEDVSHWTDGLIRHACTVLGLLDQGREGLSEYTAHLVQRVFRHSDAIMSYLESHRHTGFGGLKIRHHGDFHLGQVLIAKDDAYILDFEGEPRRSLEERRAKAPPARDVSGFIRSIDYAASTALDRVLDLNADERTALRERTRAWTEELTDGYWASYRETIGESQLWPVDDERTRRLLDFFLLEKALYEIEYELTNRPSWSHIPLEATLRILQQRGVIP